MRQTSVAFRRALADDKRDYITKMRIYLASGGAIGGNSAITGFISLNVTPGATEYKITKFDIDGFRSRIVIAFGDLEERDYVFVMDGSNKWVLTDAQDVVATNCGISGSGDASQGDTLTVRIVKSSLIWFGSPKIEDAVSNDNDLEVGGVIVNKATLVLNNIYDDFKEFDFYDSIVALYVGLDDLSRYSDPSHWSITEYLLMGTYLTSEVDYDGSTVTLTCLDNMSKFDKPYVYDNPPSSGVIYDIILTLCARCGVTGPPLPSSVPNGNFVVTNIPSTDANLTYRQVLSWLAQIAGCFARCDNKGRLVFSWYDMSFLTPTASNELDGGHFDDSTPYASGDSADGGTFNPWNTGDVFDDGNFSSNRTFHVIPGAYSQWVDREDIEVSGVIVIYKVDSGSSSENVSILSGTDDKYVIVIKDNDMITPDIAQSLADYLGGRFIGMKFRRAQIAHPSDPSIEAGDVAYYTDFRGNAYRLIVSSTIFSIYDSQNTTSSAQSTRSNSATLDSIISD